MKRLARKYKGKNAYMMTFEAVLAIVISFLFITFMVKSKSPTEMENPDLDLVSIMKDNPQFRNCALSSNLSCLNNTIRLHYPDFANVYGYDFNITVNPRGAPPDLPVKDIHLESIFIAGNDTYLSPRVVRLYYWQK